MWLSKLTVVLGILGLPLVAAAQDARAPVSASGQPPIALEQTTPDLWKDRMGDPGPVAPRPGGAPQAGEDYRIGPNALISVRVLEAPDLSQPVRVSASGEISIPPDLLQQRKREHTLEWHAEQRAGYLRLRERLPRMQIVDAAREQAEVRRTATSLIWNQYRTRFRETHEAGR